MRRSFEPAGVFSQSGGAASGVQAVVVVKALCDKGVNETA